MHDISPYNLDRTISISGDLKEIGDAEQLITEKLRQYEVNTSLKNYKSYKLKIKEKFG